MKHLTKNSDKLNIMLDLKSKIFMRSTRAFLSFLLPKFQRKISSEIQSGEGELRLKIFVDKPSIEIFTNDGKEVFALSAYPEEKQTGIEFFY